MNQSVPVAALYVDKRVVIETHREQCNIGVAKQDATNKLASMRRTNIQEGTRRKIVPPLSLSLQSKSAVDAVDTIGVTSVSSSSDNVPPEITCDADACDAASVESMSRHGSKRRWDRPYVGTPVVDRGTILAVGFFIFVLAAIWPPLILLFAYIASKLIPYSFRENDDAAVRRGLYTQFCNEQTEDLPEKFNNIRAYVNLEESYWTNDRGMALCTTIMTPRNNKPVKAVVCFCHGYTDHVSFAKLIEFQRLCDAGLAFCAIEYEGHGRSDGALCLINDWEDLIDDVSSFFKHVTEKRFPNHPAFLMGESMGGAVSYCVYNRMPTIFRGVVFLCPMCKISDDMLPPQFVIDFLKWLIGPSGTASTYLGYLPIAPSKNDFNDLIDRIKEKALRNARCPFAYGRNPRLATARELIGVTQRISASSGEFSAPFLILHGKEDRVTDPMLSQALYNESKSVDKSIQLYDGMWHALTTGESDENIDRVFGDVTRWILARV